MNLHFPKISGFRTRMTFYSFIRHYYSHILTAVAFLLLMYVAYVFYAYDYQVVNATYPPSLQDVQLRREALEKLTRDITARQETIPDLPAGLKNPFFTPSPTPLATKTPSPTPIRPR